jgi:hypothetical protein
MAAKVSRRKGEILDELQNAKKVNALRGIPLDCEIYECEGKLYKKRPSGGYRELVRQDSRLEYPHYFLRDKNKKKLTINVNKLHLLTYKDNVDDGSVVEMVEMHAEPIKDSPESEK